MILSKDNILQAQDLKTELVPVPEWGGDVYVRGMTGGERDKWEASIVSTNGRDQKINMVNARAKLASMTICDEKGIRFFTDADIVKLATKSAAALQRIYVVATRLSGIGEEDVSELTEGLKENPLDDSASDSPSS